MDCSRLDINIPYLSNGQNQDSIVLIEGLKTYQGEAREKLFSGIFSTLKPGGMLYVCNDAGGEQRDFIYFVKNFGFDYVGIFKINTLTPRALSPDHIGHQFMRPPFGNVFQPLWDALDIPSDWKVLDVGPGNLPFPKATHFLDHPDRVTKKQYSDYRLNKPTQYCDIQTRTPYHDKEFDFVWCSHVLEHLHHPHWAASEISRIGKAGILIVPSYAKEVMFFWEESDHKWNIYPPGMPSLIPVFFKADRICQQRLIDKGVQSALCRLYRSGPFITSDHRTLANWYRKNELKLDIVYLWANQLRLRMIT